MPLQATSGAASYDGFGGGAAAVPNYIEDVFSTYLYTGNGSTQTITNNISITEEGALVWIKRRTGGTGYHILTDTVRGAGLNLSTNAQIAQYNDGQPTFNSNGFNLINNNPDYNASASTYVSWTFRKQPKFFDIVTYTGTGSARTVSHDLGSTPGFIIVKSRNNTYNWATYHRSLGATKQTYLDATDTTYTGSSWWNNTAPTDSVFTVGTSTDTNNSGTTYIAYLFAHDAGGFGLTGTDNIITCGSFTTDASGNCNVDLGWEPQWVLYKPSNNATNWQLVDNMRGITADNGANVLAPNTDAAEQNLFGYNGVFNVNSTGFTGTSNGFYASRTYIYIAIRRGPMKVPTSGTSVFAPVTYTGDNSNTRVITTGFPPDMVWTGTTNERRVGDRLRGLFTNPGPINTTYSSSDEQLSAYSLPQMSGWQTGNGTVRFENSTAVNYVLHAFKRAPSFFDVVCYTGTGSARTVAHNLAAVPELMIVKCRSAANGGLVYNKTITASKFLELFFTGEGAFAASGPDAGPFNSTTPTSSVFSVGTYSNTNGSGATYVAYLFATCAGVSKVGSYTGTATTLQIDCGFTAGSRFVLIKRTDSTGDWYLWDSARGIVAGNDPYLLLNSSAAEVTNTDYIDTYSAGFEISSTAPAAINASGGTFIFLAIA
jgi:hypothetical protein